MSKQPVAVCDPKDGQEELSVNPWFDPKLNNAFFDNSEIALIRERATEYARAGVPLHLTGPAGLGKTAMAFQVANALDRPIAIMTGNAWLSAADFLGGEVGSSTSTVVDKYVQSVRRTERQTRRDWSNSVLASAMRLGHTLIYDEFTRASPEANSTLLSVLEEGLLVSTDPANPNGQIRAHTNFRVILTSNPHDYAAVKSVPDALMDRVVTVQMAEFDADTISGIVEARTGLAQHLALRVVRALAALQNDADAHRFSMLRSAILIGRIASFREKTSGLTDKDIVNLVTDVLRGRGVSASAHTIATALERTKAA